MRVKLYFKDKSEFVQYKNKIKLFSCPRCNTRETLVLYGPYKDKGHRCLCSNRFKKRGCGITFCFLWGDVIKYHSVKPHELWTFLLKLLSVKNISHALKTITNFSRRAANHWLRKLKCCQSTIRNNLIKILSPPFLPLSDPFLQTIFHLKICFKKSCPVYGYQTCFQKSIFEK